MANYQNVLNFSLSKEHSLSLFLRVRHPGTAVLALFAKAPWTASKVLVGAAVFAKLQKDPPPCSHLCGRWQISGPHWILARTAT